ncbi:MAG: Methyltransferase [Cryobacterium sp.]|jgi:SAM-dependent methyltransferase|nr:Methyltransferase [Cryobacterium sp.]
MAAHVPDRWERGTEYENYVGRWSRRVAPGFLSWLDLPEHLDWLDVGCGTGALCTAILDASSPATVVGVEPSEGFLDVARGNLAGRAILRQGSAEAIPVLDAAADVVVSGLVLNFLTDARLALSEMTRASRNGGAIAAYVWDYGGKMEFMRHFWDAAVDLDPHASALDEAARFPLCRAEALFDLFAVAGLTDVEVTGIDIETRFAGFDDYWRPFEGGQGPAPAYAMSLGEAARERLRDGIRSRLPVESDGSISLVARAWAVRSISP